MKIERRIQEDINVNGRTIYGYALKFDVLSQPFDWGNEIIRIESLDQSVIKSSDVEFLVGHDRSKLLGRCKFGNGSLKLEIDDVGLKYEVDAPNTSIGDETLELIKRGDLSGASFAFLVESEKLSKLENGKYLREILKIRRLYDVSVVTSGQYEEASVGIRSIQDRIELIEKDKREKEIDEIIKDTLCL